MFNKCELLALLVQSWALKEFLPIPEGTKNIGI